MYTNAQNNSTRKSKKTTNGLNQTCKFYTVKETIKRQPMDWEKIFAKDMMDKDLISKIYKTAQ